VSKRSCLRVFGEYNSSSHDTEEELSHPMGRDKAKSAVQKGKGKAGSSSQSGSESLGVGGGGMIKSLCKTTKQFVKAQL
jgi:hypothetical protein